MITTQNIIVYDINNEPVYSLTQWDKNVTIYIRDLAVTSAQPVRFFNRNSELALVVESSYEDGILSAKIPNSLLCEALSISGYVYVTENDESKSVYGFRINVKRHPRPSDIVSVEDTDYICLEDVLTECREWAKQVNASIDSVKSSESNAAISENNAAASAAAALEFENNALSSEKAASQSEQNAKSYAIGGTGTRLGEDTDNAKYYSEQSAASANTANQYVKQCNEIKASSEAAVEQAVGAVTTKQLGKKIVSGEITKIVLLGDSITHGTGGSGYGTDRSNPDGYCWANAVKKLVWERYGATVTVMGYYGSVASLQVENALKALTGDELVIWLSGTNNRDTQTLYESYQTNIGSYIAQLKANSAALLVMGCCPASGADDAQYYKTTLDINDVLMSKAYGVVPYISMYQEYSDACASKNLTIPETLVDGLHPNDIGHQIIFEVLCREIGLLLDANVDYSYSGEWWGGSLPNGPSYEYPFPESYALSGETFIGVGNNQNWLVNYPVPAGKVVEMKINSRANGTYNLYFARINGSTATIIKAVPVTLVSGLNSLSLDIDLEESCYFVADGYARFYDSSDATHHAQLPNGDLFEGSEYSMTMDAADMVSFALWMKVQIASQ